MRKIVYAVLACACALVATAQSNNQFVYSAIARDAQGAPIVNQNISVEISILSDSTNNTASYVETHSVDTDPYGVFTAVVGDGNSTVGSLDSVEWAASAHYLNIGIDFTGGSNYVDSHTSRIYGTPYANVAESANEATRADTALYLENNPIYDNAGVAQLRTMSGIVIPNVDSTAASSLTGANGQLIYNSTFEELQVWSGGTWKSLKPATSGTPKEVGRIRNSLILR